MSHPPEDKDMQQLWQAQAIEAPRISLQFVQHRARDLERRARHRNALEYLIAALGVIAFGWFMWRLPFPVVRIGLVLAMLATLYAAYRWNRRAAAENVPVEAGVMDALAFHRAQLRRQLDVRRNNWKWYLAPMLPGFVVTFAGLHFEYHPMSWWQLVFAIGWATIVIAAALGINARTARRLQQEIYALDSLKSSPAS